MRGVGLFSLREPCSKSHLILAHVEDRDHVLHPSRSQDIRLTPPTVCAGAMFE